MTPEEEWASLSKTPLEEWESLPKMPPLAAQGPPPSPGLVESAKIALTPVARGVMNAAMIPVEVYRAIKSIPQIEPAEFLPTRGRAVGETVSGIQKQIEPMALPAILGTVGLVGGPTTAAGGVAVGTLLEYARQKAKEIDWADLIAHPEIIVEATRIHPNLREPLEHMVESLAAFRTLGATGKTTRAIVHGAPRILPGSAAALQAEAIEMAKGTPGKIQIGPPSSVRYQRYQAAGPVDIPTPKLARAVVDLSQKEGQIIKSWQEAGITDPTSDITDLLMSSPRGLPLERLRTNLSRAGAIGRRLEETNPQVSGAAQKIFKAGWEDIEDFTRSTGGPQARLLKEANRTYRREMAQETLDEKISGTPTKRGAIYIDGDVWKINTNPVLDWIRRDKFWRDSLAPSELNDIVSTLEYVGKTPKLPPPRGTMYGFGAVAGRMSLGGGAGYAAGGPIGMAVGGYLGANAPNWFGRLLMTKGGRTALREARRVSGGPWLTDDQLSRLSTIVGVAAGPLAKPQPSGLPQPVSTAIQSAQRTGEWAIRAGAQQMQAIPMRVLQSVYEAVGGDRNRVAEKLRALGYDPEAPVE